MQVFLECPMSVYISLALLVFILHYDLIKLSMIHFTLSTNLSTCSQFMSSTTVEAVYTASRIQYNLEVYRGCL